ncbi:MAG: type IVB secretion system coupling complex protein DotM/IcmP [Legionellales bacterium]|nr:type IVB secretion system coupling complex protein DotM/IcmP [Legionellales bacterium]
MAAPQQQQQSDSSYDLAYIAVFLFAVGYGVWYFYHDQIVYYVFKLKLFEAHLVDLVTDDLDYDMVLLESLEPSSVTINGMLELAREVGRYFRYPVILVLSLLAVLLYFKSASNKFKTKYSMNSLAVAEKVNWPQITPILHLNLVEQPIMEGPWSMALAPMEFAKKYKIIEVTMPENVGSRKEIPSVKLIRNKARTVFVEQLGGVWTDVDSIPIYAKALFGIFSARINRDRGDADRLIKQLAASANSRKLNYSGTDKLVKKYIDSKLVQKVISKHAYYLTVMASMLAAAREDGVVASADFLWLKPIDRKLWYVLNCVGRQTPYTEIAGPFAHWVAEKSYGKKIKTPMVDTAVDALEFALSEIIYKEDDE